MMMGGDTNKMKMFKSKKGNQQLWGLFGSLMALGIIGVGLGFLLLILSTLMANTTIAANPNALAAVNATIIAIAQAPTYFGLLVLALIFTVLIAAIIGVWAYMRYEQD